MRAEVPFPSFWVTFWTAPPAAIGAKRSLRWMLDLTSSR